MSEKNRNPEMKKQVIIQLWRETGKQAAGGTELELLQQALATRLGPGASESPASIARTLADHGVRLQHPEILEADLRWRQERTIALFSSAELNLGTLEDANALIPKIERLHREFAADDARVEHLRESVRQLKGELDLIVVREKVEKRRQLAQEVAQWLTIWLQNPAIFPEWLDLRRATAEFRERFG